MFEFEITKKGSYKKERLGTIHTKNGDIQTPAFAVVGTKATVKALTPKQVLESGAQVMLANTFHLYLEPGRDVVKKHGGFGPMAAWHGPTITDSGGFQAFSLGAAFGRNISKVARGDEDALDPTEADLGTESFARIDEDGVSFKSPIDGSLHRFTPESSMEVQWDLGADIIFAFDECTSPMASYEYQREAMDRTHRWAKRCIDRHEQLDTEKVQALFGVVQGGRFEDLRKESAKVLGEMNFDGFGIGGSFNKDDLGEAVGWVSDTLPEEKPRHLLGIGEPGDVVLGVKEGMDLFDCVSPTRIARNGRLHTRNGDINIFNASYKNDFSRIEEGCECYTCQNFTKAYIAHLFRSKEMLAGTLASIHNVYFMNKLFSDIRDSIKEDRFEEFEKEFFSKYYAKK